MAKQSTELFGALETAIIDELAARKAKGISRNSISEALAIKSALLCEIVRRGGGYSITKLLDICEALGINVKFDIQ